MGWIALVLILFVVFLVFAYTNPLGKGSAYVPDAAVLERLAGQAVGNDEEGHKVFGEARAEKRGGLHLLWLKGSPYEMGYQHGRLLREQIREGAMPYHAFPIYNLPPFSQMAPWMKWLLVRYYDWTVFRSLMKHAPARFLEEVKGLADGSGLTFDLVLRGNLLSEFNMITTKTLKKMMLRRLQPAHECTSFAAFGSMTRDGSLIMGRNTDYNGAGLWDVTQTVFFYAPKEGYSYVNVGSAGLIKCNSCMNERGLCLGGHFLFSDDVTADGEGFTALEHEIMQHAASIDEAYQIVSGRKRAGVFAYLLASAEQKQAAVIDATASRTGLRWAEGDAIWETNFMTCEETREVDDMFALGITKYSLSRYKRMEELIQQNASSITPQRAASFMGDHMDMTSGDIRPFGNVIATLWTLTSVVFKPDDFTFWVADGLAPVSNNTYVGFHFLKEMNREPYLVTPQILEPNEYVKTAGFEALRQYYPIQVKAVLPPFERARLAEEVKAIVKMIPGEVAYRMLLAKQLLRNGDVEKASDQFKMLVDYALSPSEQAQVMLFLGYTYDIKGERDRAKRCYGDILQKTQSPPQDQLTTINPFIQADAQKYLQRPFSGADQRRIEINMDMFSLYDR